MIFFFALLALPPLASLGWIAWARRPRAAEWQHRYLPRVGWLFALGLFASWPFLNGHGLGTGEAYNYSLSTADTVTQIRAGVFPVLAGQTDFAWNGRIHPLRTAPYMSYFAAALDLLTGRRLNFWALQNLTLALSFVGATFSCYIALRRATAVEARVALVLSGAYVLAPATLAAAYAMDLYMTVMTLPFIPLALMCALRACTDRATRGNLALLAAALVAAWLAHPPVALWLSVTCGVLLAPLLLRPRTWPALALAGLLGVTLVQFVFVSVLSIQESGQLTNARTIDLLVSESQRVFVDSLQPVSASSDKLGDFQLGYAYWLLLAVSLALTIARRRLPAFRLLAVASLLLALTLPSDLQVWLWHHAPSIFVTLTNQWPMQRTYLLTAVIILFAFADSYRAPRIERWPHAWRDFAGLALLVPLFWTGHEAWKFIRRGLDVRRGAAESALIHRPENIDLTVTSFAITGTPPWFVSGVMDPTMEMRLLSRGDTREIASNWTAPIVANESVVKGEFRQAAVSNGIVVLEPSLTLQPGQHYRLDFDFLRPPFTAVLQLEGSGFHREYPLGGNDGTGFGMRPTNRHALSLWTTGAAAQEITLQVVAPDLGNSESFELAHFTFAPIDPARLPAQMESLFPFCVKTRAIEPAYLETPRSFIPGYAANVDGHSAYVRRSPNGLAMVPVPAGESRVELRYEGSRWLRASFWLSTAGWIGFFIVGTMELFAAARLAAARRALLVPLTVGASWLWRRRIATGTALILSVLLIAGGQRYFAWRAAVGPLHVRLTLQLSEVGRSQPLLTTGRPQQGTFLFLVLADPTHVRVGMDVWGVGYWVSEPIPVDYYDVQDFVISSGALYPSGHPGLAGLSAAEIAALRNRITIDLNGRRVLDQKIFSFDSRPADISVGLNRIGGSHAEPRLVGKIESIERLPVPRP
jgi:hypothetical protein